MTIDLYLEEIAGRLERFGPLASRPLSEIREHLLDLVQALMTEGLRQPDAEQAAIERFGDFDTVAGQLALTLRKERDPVERIVKIVAITNLFTAVWGLAGVAMLNPLPALLAATATPAVASVAAALAIMRRNPDPGALIITGVVMIAVGIAGVLWALIGHDLAVVKPEWTIALLMGTYVAQGVLTLWAAARRQGAPVSGSATA